MWRSLRWKLAPIRWKLTIIYIGASLFSLILADILLLFSVFFFGLPSEPTKSVEEEAISIAQTIRPFFEYDNPDSENLHSQLEWLLANRSQGVRELNIGGDTAFAEVRIVESGIFVALLDTRKEVLTTAHSYTFMPMSFLDELQTPNVQNLISIALSGTTPSTLIMERDRQPAIATPILSQDGNVLGVVYVRNNDLSLWEELVLLPASALVSILPEFFISVLVGLLVYILLVGRSFNHRLKRLSHVSAAFGQGQLHMRAQDSSSDEIGQLADQFNIMADQILELTQQSAHLATIEERNRLARELHDSVKQHVFAANMKLGAAQELWQQDMPAAVSLVNGAMTAIEQARRDLTAIIPSLRPFEVTQQGLAQSIHRYLQLWEQQNGIRVIQEIDTRAKILSPEIEQTLFRILQEAFTNIARHSNATEVRCILDIHLPALTLQIHDNGNGFATQTKRIGLGLQSMNERAQAIGGELIIQSDTTGTLITLTAPHA